MNLTRNVAILCIALVISSLSGCDKPRPDGMPDLVCGKNYTLKANAFVRDGWYFTGWNSEPQSPLVFKM